MSLFNGPPRPGARGGRDQVRKALVTSSAFALSTTMTAEQPGLGMIIELLPRSPVVK